MDILSTDPGEVPLTVYLLVYADAFQIKSLAVTEHHTPRLAGYQQVIVNVHK